jgi:hypothetical protein
MVSLALALSACGGSGGSTSDIEVSADGSFTATSLSGEPVALSDYAGQDVMLWFWAPW